MDQKDNNPFDSIRTGGGMLQQGNGRKDIADHSGTEALRKERTVDIEHLDTGAGPVAGESV